MHRERDTGEIGRLKQEQEQIREVYASLQEILNRRTGEVASLKEECKVLKEKANQSFQRET